MTRPSIEILPPSLDPVVTRVGDKVPAAGIYGHTLGFHTIAIKLNNFQGRVYIEGSLALDPGDADWFQLLPNNTFMQFPNQTYPATPFGTGYSGVVGLSFQVNCLWLRARVDRSYLIPVNSNFMTISAYGSVDNIMGNYSLSGIGPDLATTIAESLNTTTQTLLANGGTY